MLTLTNIRKLLGKGADNDMQQVQTDTVALEYHRMVIDAHKDEVESLRQAAFEAARREEAARSRADHFGKLANELLAERDEARAIIAARREKAKRNLRQFKGKQGAADTVGVGA